MFDARRFDLHTFAATSRGELILFFSYRAIGFAFALGRIPGALAARLKAEFTRGGFVWLDWAGVVASQHSRSWSMGVESAEALAASVAGPNDLRFRSAETDEKRIFFTTEAIDRAVTEGRLDADVAVSLRSVLGNADEIGVVEECSSPAPNVAALLALPSQTPEGWYDSHGNFHRESDGEAPCYH